MRWFTHSVYIIHICIICTWVYFWACERNCIYAKVNLHMCKYTPPCKYTPAQTRCIFAFAYMYFLHVCIFGHVNAQQIYTRMQMQVFLLFQVKLAVRIKYFCVKSKKYFIHLHFKTNTALRIKFHAHYVFTKILIFSYTNAQIHHNVTMQYLKNIPFVQKAWKTCVHTSVSDKIPVVFSK